MHIFKHTHYDILKYRWHAIAVSWIIIIAGVVVLMTRGIPLGIEFAGGTEVIVHFDAPTSVQQVRAALDKSFPGGGQNVIVQSFGDPSQQLEVCVLAEEVANVRDEREVVRRRLAPVDIKSASLDEFIQILESSFPNRGARTRHHRRQVHCCDGGTGLARGEGEAPGSCTGADVEHPESGLGE